MGVFLSNMILIGAEARNVGKTTLATRVVSKFSRSNVVGVKVTVIHDEISSCPRGAKANCSVCTSLEKPFEIIEETGLGAKDTHRLLASGAKQVFWLKVDKGHIEEGVSELVKLIPDNTPIVCESNSLRHVVTPGLFIMLKNIRSNSVKSSAASVQKYVDLSVTFDGTDFDIDLNSIVFEGNLFSIK